MITTLRRVGTLAAAETIECTQARAIYAAIEAYKPGLIAALRAYGWTPVLQDSGSYLSPASGCPEVWVHSIMVRLAQLPEWQGKDLVIGFIEQFPNPADFARAVIMAAKYTLPIPLAESYGSGAGSGDVTDSDYYYSTVARQLAKAAASEPAPETYQPPTQTYTPPKTTNPPATTTNPPAAPPPAPTFSFRNLSTGNASIFKVGDQWRASFTGPAGAVVSVSGGKNGATGTVQLGTIGSSGTLELSGSPTAADIGAWNETWYVGAQAVATIGFTVVPLANSASTPPTTNNPPATTSNPPATTSNPPATTNPPATKSAIETVTDGAGELVNSVMEWITGTSGAADTTGAPGATATAPASPAGILDRLKTIPMWAYLAAAGAGYWMLNRKGGRR